MRNLFWALLSFLFLFPFSAASSQSRAGSVDIETIKSVAKNYFIKTEPQYSGAGFSDFTLTIADTRKSGDIVLAYVFNIDYNGTARHDDGYIIMSADYNQTPVLAYFPEGSYDISALPYREVFTSWFNGTLDQIEADITNKTINSENASLWSEYLSKGAFDSQQMILHFTPTWYQNFPYNHYTPATTPPHPEGGYYDNGHTLTGCVATAMAMIMYYYKWPLSGVGSHSYTDPANTSGTLFYCGIDDPSYGTQQFFEHEDPYTYDYASMPDKPTEVNNAISKLMYNCGVSVDMDYEFCQSWAYTYKVAEAMRSHFRYNDSIDYKNLSDYSSSAWLSIILRQLKWERPVLMRGRGHAFVICGYKITSNATQLYINEGDGYAPGYLAYKTDIGDLIITNIYPTSQPNLKITSASAPASVDIGSPFNVSFNIMNAGSRSTLSTSTTAVYLSTDTTLDKTDTYLGVVSTPVLESGSSTGLSGSVTIEAGDPGNYYLIFNADSAHYVPESSEFDNNFHIQVTAQSAGIFQYQTKGSGNWSDASTWQYYDSGWKDATSTPNAASSTITILSGHTVTVTSDLSVNQTIIESGGKVTVNNCNLTISDGTGTDFTVNGTLELTGSSGRISGGGSLVFNSNSTYIHNRDKGEIPTATWATTSNCIITGMVNDYSSSSDTPTFNQSFGNFTWNCPGQTNEISLFGNLRTIKGNLSVINTGSNDNYFALGGNTEGNITIDGNFIQTGGKFTVCRGIAQRTMTVKGNFVLSDGTFNMGYSAAPLETLNVMGDFSHTGGTITASNTTGDNIVFNGTGVQTFTSGGTVGSLINFTVDSGSTLQMGTGASPSILSGTEATFTLSEGASLGITSPDGISALGSTGNIQVGGSRTYNEGANYIYNGTANQFTGNALPEYITGNLTINNTGSSDNNIVTLSNGCQIGWAGALNLIKGVFNASNLLTMEPISTINRSGGSITWENPTWSYYRVNYSGSSMTASDELTDYRLYNMTVDLTPGQVLSLSRDMYSMGGLFVVSGTLDLGNNTWYQIGTDATLSVSDGATLKIGGNKTIPLNFATYDFDDFSTVEYYGDAQVVYPQSEGGYGNLTLSGTGIKTIEAGTAVTVKNDLVTNDLLTVSSAAMNLHTNGSLIVRGNATGSVTYLRQLNPESHYGSYHYFSSPVESNTAANADSVNAVWSWNEVNQPGENWVLETGGLIGLTSGRGYNLSQVPGCKGVIKFAGSLATSISVDATSPYLDAITASLDDYTNREYDNTLSGHSGNVIRNSSSHYGAGGWNLLGNPYTSSIKVSDFINANYSETPELNNFDPNYVAVYLYDETVDPYGKYYYIGNSDGWGTAADTATCIQAGQGFFVLAMNDNSTFTFTRSMQRHSTGTAMLKSTKKGDPWPGVELTVRLGEYKDATKVIYNDDMTFDLDPGYDIGQLTSGSPVEIYTTLVNDNGFSFARQALPPADLDSTEIPVGITCYDGGVVTFCANVMPLEHYKFYLEDHQTGIITNLNTSTYTVEIPANTSGTGRFYLRTTYTDRRDKKDETAHPELPNPRIWSSGHQVIIEGEVSAQAVVRVYDLYGHIITEQKLTDTNYNTIDLPATVKGLCIVKVNDQHKSINARVVIL